MQMFQAGGDITLQIMLTDENENPVAPTSLTWRLLDIDEVEIVAPQAIAGPYDEFVDIVVSGARNALPTGATMTARTLELTITTTNDTIYKRATYGLGARQRLQILVNSFQTLTSAELHANMIPDLDGWTDAASEAKIIAMIEAFRRLTNLGYAVRWPLNADAQNTIVWDSGVRSISPRFWHYMTMDQYLTFYPEEFRAALRLAQISEADAILTVDPLSKRREQGITSEQIGEARVAYGDSKIIDFGLSTRTLRYLDGYVALRMTTVRS